MKENEQKIEQSENELNEEALEQVQGGLMRKLYVPDNSFRKQLKEFRQKNSDEKEKPSVNPAEAGGPKIVVILQ